MVESLSKTAKEHVVQVYSGLDDDHPFSYDFHCQFKPYKLDSSIVPQNQQSQGFSNQGFQFAVPLQPFVPVPYQRQYQISQGEGQELQKGGLRN